MPTDDSFPFKDKFSEKEQTELIDNQINCYEANISSKQSIFFSLVIPLVLTFLGFLFVLIQNINQNWVSIPKIIATILLFIVSALLLRYVFLVQTSLDKLRNAINSVYLFKQQVLAVGGITNKYLFKMFKVFEDNIAGEDDSIKVFKNKSSDRTITLNNAHQ